MFIRPSSGCTGLEIVRCCFAVVEIGLDVERLYELLLKLGAGSNKEVLIIAFPYLTLQNVDVDFDCGSRGLRLTGASRTARPPCALYRCWK